MDLKNLLKKKYYLQGFNGTPGLLVFGAPSMMGYMYKHLGYGYTVLIDFYENDKCYYCYAWDDLNNIKENLLKRVKKDKSYLKELEDKHKSINKKHLALLKQLDKLNFRYISDQDILENYHLLAESFGELLGVSHIVEGFTLTCEERIRELLIDSLKIAGREAEFNLILAALTEPIVPSFLGEARNAIQRAALLKQKDKNINKELEKLQQGYYWLKNGYSHTEVLDKDYFLREIEHEKELDEDKIKNFEESFKGIKSTKLRLFKELNLSKELIMLLEILDTITYIHDDRKHKITMTLGYLDLLLKEIAKRYNLRHENIRYLVSAEINDKNLRDIDDKSLEERKERCIFFHTYGSLQQLEPLKRFAVFTGEEAGNMIKQLMDEKASDIKELKGNCASPGRITGTIKVCRGAEEIGKMKHGDILVACMTQPEFVPAMKKAKAIITDEGGLTCHAAIVSRELKIPCVIGTKNATKVLKDGMKVEVDADNGIVRIL